MNFIKIKSKAKINLSLNIIGKFKSKFHKVESIITFIDLGDTIYLRPKKQKNHKIHFFGKFSKGIKKKNTVSKLLKILDKKKLLKGKKFEIKILKNIPQKSGMGGGSMNASNLINFFLKKKIFKLSQKNLINLAKLIGADVILGINQKNSILLPNGKIIKSKKIFNFYVLIVKPNFGCSTKLIYSKVNTFSKSKYQIIKNKIFNKKEIIISKNDLEEVAFKTYPKLRKLKLFLSGLSNVIFVRMTGSGSSICAYFQSKKAVDIATREFKKKFNNYWCNTSKTI